MAVIVFFHQRGLVRAVRCDAATEECGVAGGDLISLRIRSAVGGK